MASRTLIGLMSGSSLDGLDVICINFSFHYYILNWDILCDPTTVEYPSNLQDSLRIAHTLDDLSLKELDLELGQFFGRTVKKYIEQNKLAVDVIASHGHTVRHHPELGFTLQIGDGQEMANASGLTCICDFRSADIEAGGQGAPLAPVVEKYLFADQKMFLNIGGIANLSVHSKQDIIAYDICPVNQVLNHLANKMGKAYDDGGSLARQGEIDMDLVEHLSQDPFLDLPFPKSLDNNYIRKVYLKMLDQRNDSIENLLATCTYFMAKTIAKEISLQAKQHHLDHVFISGGGAYNNYLIDTIKSSIGDVKIVLPAKQIIEHKESMLMALCGYLKLENMPNSFAAATGALKDTINGLIFHPQS